DSMESSTYKSPWPSTDREKSAPVDSPHHVANRPAIFDADPLPILQDDPRCRFLRFKSATGRTRSGELRAHFLQTRNKPFNLPFQACDDDPLFLNRTMFLEELVEQHRVHRIIADGVWFSFRVTYHQSWIYVLYFLGH